MVTVGVKGLKCHRRSLSLRDHQVELTSSCLLGTQSLSRVQSLQSWPVWRHWWACCPASGHGERYVDRECTDSHWWAETWRTLPQAPSASVESSTRQPVTTDTPPLTFTTSLSSAIHCMGQNMKSLEAWAIEARIQWDTNRKWHIANLMVTWLMTSRDPERLRSWHRYAWGRLSWKQLEIHAQSWLHATLKVKVILIYLDRNILKSVRNSTGQTACSLDIILFVNVFTDRAQLSWAGLTSRSTQYRTFHGWLISRPITRLIMTRIHIATTNNNHARNDWHLATNETLHQQSSSQHYPIQCAQRHGALVVITVNTTRKPSWRCQTRAT